MKHYLFILIMPVLVACQAEKPDYLNMLTPAGLNQLMQEKDILLIDVHTPAQPHIKGTDLVLPYDEIAKHQAKLPQDKTYPIYLYCRSGSMANTAAKTLHDLGYQNLFNLEGGTEAWKAADLGFE